MKIAVFGGSFNPVHYGHLALAELVLQKLKYDLIVFIPAYQSPLKEATLGATPQDRLDMLIAALSGHPRCIIDDCEIRRGGLSYTIDTINDIEERYQSEQKLGLIIGDDHLVSFHKWKDATLIAQKTELLVASRAPKQHYNFPYPFVGIDNPKWMVSSSEIRDRIAHSADWTHLVPPAVASIIKDRFLYTSWEQNSREKSCCVSFSSNFINLIEDIARSWLSSSRYLHSKNVAVLSAQLCRRFQIDEQLGYLAGIAHDICKHWKSEQILKLVQYDGLPVDSIEKEKPELMHGRAAAMYLKEYHGITDKALLQAIQMHTFGGPHMGDLAKIVYIADKIEPSRSDINSALRIACRTAPLPVLFAQVVWDTVQYLQKQGKLLTRETAALLKELQQEGLL
ncbi:nicotinate (nicotinamide) nucleotide adenylyltransferase [Gracilinema caldarium]|uniref:Probable nicotinate-nucleotide adenylyltransferase n=1 Tax=Gracilinema caldarium (strain ATCC 51460 / DSM 7334 / H1) TaxID=744872 RepID=F8F076_GRAC1|nr:nicotinate (nicotinamide) nucleotide adenylyltransferase [Gracilinema caldarium]AEJ18940.1 metal dependent phosphohydrolase [Gracilinema caldarium DSM 7334]